MSEEAIVDAVVVDEPSPDAATEGTAELVPSRTGGVMLPFAEEDVRLMSQAYQRTVRAVLEPSDWQGSPGRSGSFVKKSGWRKIAKAYDLSVTIQSVSVERDDEGQPTRAEAIVRATHPNGQTQDGDGYCSADEARFSRSGGRQKLENDLRATATTRAKNRAIADLVGMGEVSAEEVELMGTPQVVAFTDSLDTPLEQLGRVMPPEQVKAVAEWIKRDNDGVMPRSVGRALVALGRIAATAADETQAAHVADDNLPF